MDYVSNGNTKPSLADLDFIKYMHMANCSEKSGNCAFCYSDDNNQSEFNSNINSKRKRSINNKNDTSNSVSERVMLYDKDVGVPNIAKKLKFFRDTYLQFIRFLWLDSKLIAFCSTLGKMQSTVKDVNLKTIIHAFGANIYSLLCANQGIVQNIPTISIKRKILITIIIIYKNNTF